MLSRIGKPGLWGIVLFILQFSLLTPMSFITISLIMIPIVVLYVICDVKLFIVLLALIGGLSYGLSGITGLVLFSMTLFFLPTAILMGHFYKQQRPAKVVVFSGIGLLFAELLLVMVIFALAGSNIPQLLADYLQDSFDSMPALWQMFPQELQERYLLMVKQMFPLYMLVFSVYCAIVTHWLARKLLSKPGQELPKLKPMKDWMVPRSLVWYYLIALFVDFFIDREDNSTLQTLLVNVVPLLMYVFAVQGVAFLFFIADRKRWNKALPVIGIVLTPFLPQFIGLLGIFDVAFNLRNRFDKP